MFGALRRILGGSSPGPCVCARVAGSSPENTEKGVKMTILGLKLRFLVQSRFLRPDAFVCVKKSQFMFFISDSTAPRVSELREIFRPKKKGVRGGTEGKWGVKMGVRPLFRPVATQIRGSQRSGFQLDSGLYRALNAPVAVNLAPILMKSSSGDSIVQKRWRNGV